MGMLHWWRHMAEIGRKPNDNIEWNYQAVSTYIYQWSAMGNKRENMALENYYHIGGFLLLILFFFYPTHKLVSYYRTTGVIDDQQLSLPLMKFPRRCWLVRWLVIIFLELVKFCTFFQNFDMISKILEVCSNILKLCS